MHWLFQAARRLRELGVLGMNRRNAACILDHNPRAKYPLVDDKLRMHDLCRRIGVPTPQIYLDVSCYAMLRRLPDLIGDRNDFVIKPNRGSAGRGVLVIVGRDGGYYLRHNGDKLGIDSIRQHISDILSGMYSLGGQPDRAMLQQCIRLHPAFAAISYKGIPDVRVILYRNDVLEMSRRVARAVGLGYVGVDIVVDVDEGPMLLEANARPGLAIQIANGQGLLPRIQAIDARLDEQPRNKLLEHLRRRPAVASQRQKAA
jgi:hypothetical protein